MDRQWPEKCARCKQKGLPCSEPSEARRYQHRRSHETGRMPQTSSLPITSDVDMPDASQNIPQGIWLKSCKSTTDPMRTQTSFSSPPEGHESAGAQENGMQVKGILDFAMVAIRPLSLPQVSLLPAINTQLKTYEATETLDIQSSTAAQFLSYWFEESLHFDPNDDTVVFGHLVGSDSIESLLAAHSYAFRVCVTYLSLSGVDVETNHNSMPRNGFRFHPEHDLFPILQNLKSLSSSFDFESDYSTSVSAWGNDESEPSHQGTPVPHFFSLWEYASLNWPFHLAQLTNQVCNISAITASSYTEISSIVADLEAFLTDTFFLSWLESLIILLDGDDCFTSERLAIAQDQLFGILKRWVKAFVVHSNEKQAQVLAKILSWLNEIQSMRLLECFRDFMDRAQRTSLLLSIWSRKLKILPSFDSLSREECLFLIAKQKFDLDYLNGVLGAIATQEEPCVMDFSRRLLFYIDKKSWSASALELLCVDMETGLILGKFSRWVRSFSNSRHRILVGKCDGHIGFQVVVAKTAGSHSSFAVTTYIWPLSILGEFSLGESLFGDLWLLDDEYELQYPPESFDETMLHRSGLLVFEENGKFVCTPSGRWDLGTRVKQCTIPSSQQERKFATIAVCANPEFKAAVIASESNPHRHENIVISRPDSQSCQHWGIFPIPDGLVPRPEFQCRFAAFNESGNKFLAQIAIQGPENQVSWYFWALQQEDDWLLYKTLDCVPDSVLPSLQDLSMDDFPKLGGENSKEKGGFSNFSAVCSVH